MWGVDGDNALDVTSLQEHTPPTQTELPVHGHRVESLPLSTYATRTHSYILINQHLKSAAVMCVWALVFPGRLGTAEEWGEGGVCRQRDFARCYTPAISVFFRGYQKFHVILGLVLTYVPAIIAVPASDTTLTTPPDLLPTSKLPPPPLHSSRTPRVECGLLTKPIFPVIVLRIARGGFAVGIRWREARRRW